MPLLSVRDIATSIEDDGATWTSWVHKTSGPVPTVTGTWNDLSMGAGIPKYNAYVGNLATATPLIGSGNNGIYVGPAITGGKSRYIHQIGLQTTGTGVPLYAMLCDYLMCYPLIDGDSADQQDMDNTSTLPRYTSGLGVQCMAVVTTPMTTNADVTIHYTNHLGVAGRTSNFTLQSIGTVGGIISNASVSNPSSRGSPFIPLQSGDLGIRSIEDVTLASGAGGFFALVLVYPLASIQLGETRTFSEITQFMHRASCPKVEDGAYLNFIYNTAIAATSAIVRGYVQFFWR